MRDLSKSAARLVVTTLLVACAVAKPDPAAAQGRWTSCPDREIFYDPFPIGLVPGVTWDTWRVLLRREWSSADRIRSGWSDIDVMAYAANQAPLDTQFHVEEPARKGDYIPQARATSEQTEAYRRAARMFRSGQTAMAAAAFDAIAAEAASPYAAASAYSATRAILSEGRFTEGLSRLGRVLADPAMREVHQAAHHLVGTLAYDTGAAPLLAARLADITHLLLAPPELRCRDIELRTLMAEANDDLDYILQGAFPADRFHDFPPWSGHTRHVLALVAAFNPVADLVRVLAVPTPFNRNRGWIEPFFPDALPYPGFSLDDQDAVAGANEHGAALTIHARDLARETGNPLWAYALAIRTSDPADLPLLFTAEATAADAPIAPGERTALVALLVAQQARVLLMAGREDDALQTLGRMPKLDTNSFSPDWLVADGGVRYLLGRRDLDGARRWAAATSGIHPRWQPALSSRVALALDWDEALDAARRSGWERDDALNSGLSLLPAAQLALLSRKPGLAPGMRRALLSAAWIRYYMLGRDVEFRALLPEIRATFPELRTDLNDVERAWTPWTRRHQITRMLLRFPGLVADPLWFRSKETGTYWGIEEHDSLLAIDTGNPSDGNWWCPVDPKRAQRNFFGLAFAQPLSSYFWVGTHTIQTLKPTGDAGPQPPDFEPLVRDWLAWHPLSRTVDAAELERLAGVQSGPVRLSGEAVAWAQGSNWLTRALGLDDNLPETLALAVRSTRYGCRRDAALGTASQEAWRALHRLYPKSDAATHTPYWFDEHAVSKPQ